MIIGIDLGTTNSLVSIWKDSKSILIKNPLGSVVTPSVVGVDDDGRIIVGQPAKDRLLTHPDRTVAIFKRLMGSNASIKIADLVLKPQELSSFILKQLKEDVEIQLGESVTEAVITVPAYFNDTQRKMTKLAGRLAGLKVERLLNEPTAAALAYGLHEENDNEILVFDLGGGTFDVSVLELFDGVMEVRASAGNNRLGGEDFTRSIAQYFTDQLNHDGLISSDITSKLEPKILAEAERAKVCLSTHQEYLSHIILDEHEVALSITRQKFESICESLLNQLQQPILQALNDSSIAPNQLDHILLVGGATRMPVISKLVTKMFGAFPNKSLDPDQAIVMGAAIQAALKSQDESINEVVLTDVCPYTLGIEVVADTYESKLVQGVFSPIIERNNTIPTSKVQTYYTVHDLQEKIDIKVFQGESRSTANNIYLGGVSVEVAKSPAGHQSVDVRFSYDTNGLLEIETLVVNTGEKKSSLINTGGDELNDEQMNDSLTKLQSLKIHPRESIENTSVLYRANRLYEQNMGKKRELVGGLVDFFTSVLESGDEERINSVREQVSRELDQYEL